MDMFKEVGSIALLQDNAEEQIYEKYKELYQEEKGCHYLVYENDSVIACGGAVIKEDVLFCYQFVEHKNSNLSNCASTILLAVLTPTYTTFSL